MQFLQQVLQTPTHMYFLTFLEFSINKQAKCTSHSLSWLLLHAASSQNHLSFMYLIVKENFSKMSP